MFDLSQTGRIARLSLNRPEARNAIPIAAWGDLADAADRAVRGGARVLIVGSAVAGVFSAGADLRELETLPVDPVRQREMLDAMNGALERLANLPIVTIAEVRGGCFGAGVALAMVCDVRIAGEGAQFAIPPARLGILYPQPDIARLVGLVGPGQARRLLLSGERIDVAEAARIGLVEMVAASADAFAETCVGSAPSSVAALKRAVASGDAKGEDYDRAFVEAFDGADFAEGITAMRERRTPEFGR